MPTSALSTKALKSKVSLENRLQFYSILTRKTESYLENILGKETFQSLQNCQLRSTEIDQINQDLISIILAEHEVSKDLDSNLKTNNKTLASQKPLSHPPTASDLILQLQNQTAILIRPELIISSEIILEFLLSQRVAIGNILELNLDIPTLVDIYNQNPNEANSLPTCLINFIHSPAKIICLKQPLNSELKDFIHKNIIQKEYELIANLFGPRITAILDPIKYVQDCYLGLIENPKITTQKSYLKVLVELLEVA
ncbi:MAG: hypothetical protein WCK98_01020 [bacterium]